MPTSATQYRLLVVDDERDNLETMNRLLRREFVVSTAESGAAAMALLEGQAPGPFDLMITDQRMPQMTGTELCARTRELFPEMIRIILTGHIDVDSLLDAINRGEIYRFVTKPWDPEDLRLTIRQALETYQLTRDNARFYQEVAARNAELAETERRLAQIRAQLEERVAQRTADLDAANQRIESTIRDLQLLTTTDPLTGLPNRRGFEAAAARELRRATFHGLELGLAIMDIDGFQAYNAQYRHTAADELLARVGATLRVNTRTLDLVARYGSDEFVLLLIESDTASTVAALERLMGALQVRVPGSPSGRPAETVRFSVGIASYPANGDSLTGLLASLEAALAAAKARGGGCVVSASELDAAPASQAAR
jgi:diguanylate cyclase (GGDEF)-like protein